MAINKIQLITKNINNDEDVLHPETSADIVRMTGFSSISSSGLIADTDNALQAIKKLQSGLQGINVFSGINGNAPGTSGFVPAPTIDDKGKFLKSDGTWSELEIVGFADRLSNAVNLQTNLSNNSPASFDGSTDVSIGVSGILPIANGGTNASTIPNARKSLFGESMTISNSKYFLTINESYSNGGYLSLSNVKSLLAINNVDNIADSNKTVAKANALTNSVNLVTDLASSGSISFNGTKDSALGVSGILPIANGGTGQNAVYNNTSVGTLNWSSNTGERVVTANTLAYWNGTYSGTSSNLAYCNKGAFGSIVTYNSPLPVAQGGTGQTSLNKITVGKANELYTSRNIDGIAFNGSSSINHFIECTTESENANKTVECPNFALEKGSRITVFFAITNTAKNPTLNINSTGNIPIYYRGYPIPAEVLQANSTYDLVYNGTYWLIIGSVIWTE